MNRVNIFISAVICFSLVACGEDIPSEAEGKQVIAKRYETSDCLKLVGFKKTNGNKSEEKSYQMEYSALMELKKGCHGYYLEKSNRFGSTPKNKFSEQGHKNMTGLGYKHVKEGEQVSLTGRIYFSKKENGWDGREIIF